MTHPTLMMAQALRESQRRGWRVAIVDGHPVTRLGVHAVLEAEPDLAVIGEVGSGTHALRLVELAEPDVMVLGHDLTGEFDGLQTCRAVSRLRSPPAVLVYTIGGTDELASYFLVGAHSVLHRRSSAAALVEVVRRTARGEQLWEDPDRPEEPQPVVRSPATGPEVTLREAEVLALKLRRRTNAEIAQQLHISVSTVKHHVSSVYSKLGSVRADLLRGSA